MFSKLVISHFYTKFLGEFIAKMSNWKEVEEKWGIPAESKPVLSS